MAAATKRKNITMDVKFTPTELNHLGKLLAKKLSKYFLYVNDNMSIKDGKLIIKYAYGSINQRKYEIKGSNFTFTTYLIVSKDDSSEVIVSHNRNRFEIKREFIQMTERVLKDCIDNIDELSIDGPVSKQDYSIASVPKKEYTPLRKYKTIAEEIKHNSEPLTDFSKDVMVTAEVSFDTTPKKKQKPVAEYNIRVFSKDDTSNYKKAKEDESSSIIQKLFKIITRAIVIPSAIYAVYALVRHYIIK